MTHESYAYTLQTVTIRFCEENLFYIHKYLSMLILQCSFKSSFYMINISVYHLKALLNLFKVCLFGACAGLEKEGQLVLYDHR